VKKTDIDMSMEEREQGLARFKAFKTVEKKRIGEIVSLHSEIGGYLKITLDKAIRIGQLLSEQKASMKHGRWLSWGKDNLPFLERSGRNYLRMYDHREELKTANVADLTEARNLLTVPLTAVTEQVAGLRKEKGVELAAKDKDKADKKEQRQRPVWVKEYLDANVAYKAALASAINRKKAGVYAPEDMQFITNRHEKTIELMTELDESDNLIVDVRSKGRE